MQSTAAIPQRQAQSRQCTNQFVGRSARIAAITLVAVSASHIYGVIFYGSPYIYIRSSFASWCVHFALPDGRHAESQTTDDEHAGAVGGRAASI